MELLVTDIANDPRILVTESGDSKKAYQIGGGFNIPIYYSTYPWPFTANSTTSIPTGQSSVYYNDIFSAKANNFYNKTAAPANLNNVDFKFSGWNLVYNTWIDTDPESEDHYEVSYVPIGASTSLSTVANKSVDAYIGGPGSATKEYDVVAGYTWCWSSRGNVSGEGNIAFERDYYDGVNNTCLVTATPSAGYKFDYYEFHSTLWPSNSGSGTENPFTMGDNLLNVYTAVFKQYDPYNPLELPSNTVRVRTNDGQAPVKASSTSYETATLVPGTTNVWDVYKSGTSLRSLFNKSTNVIEVLGANTTGITDMAYMFNGCSSLTTVALFDTSGVIDISGMFQNCSSLTTVPLFDTSKVTNMNYMFAVCSSLTTVPLFDTSNVKVMQSTFSSCTSLTTVPLFNTSKVTHIDSMFKNCINVESGALALYQQVSSQATPPSDHISTFKDCGRDTISGAAELAQIPSNWK